VEVGRCLRDDLDSRAPQTSRLRARKIIGITDRVAVLPAAKIIKNRGHFRSDEAVIKPLRTSEIGLAVPDVSALTTTVTPPLGLLLSH
jgi:hypothetical protein